MPGQASAQTAAELRLLAGIGSIKKAKRALERLEAAGTDRPMTPSTPGVAFQPAKSTQFGPNFPICAS